MDTVLHRSHRIHAGFPFTSVWRKFTSFFDTINRSLEAQSAYTRLSQLSDAELAHMGIKREDIAQHIAKKFF